MIKEDKKTSFLDLLKKSIYIYDFEIQPLEDMMINTYKSSAVRGFLGFMLKKILCPLKREKCLNCQINSSCKYFNFFENSKLIKKEDKILVRDLYKPYIIYSSNERRIIPSNETFKFRITLFGKENNKMLPYIILSLKEGGLIYGLGSNKAKFNLVQIYSSNNKKIIQNNSEVKNYNNPIKIPFQKESLNKLKVNLISPVVIKNLNKEEFDLDFFVANIIKRAYLITKYYINNSFSFNDYKNTKEYYLNMCKSIVIKNKNLNYRKIYRFSNRKKTKMYFAGFTGDILFEGKEIKNDIINLLKLGEYIHVGKNCSFGFGKIKVEV